MIVPPDQYFVHRESVEESHYWGNRRDPDGVVRDRLSDEERIQYLEDICDELVFVQSLPTNSILDVGCGPGWFLETIVAQQKYGTEICPIAIAEAKSRGLRVKDTTQYFPSAMFDVVRAHHVIEHLQDPVAEIKEMRRVCRGWLLLSTPDFGSPGAERFGDQYRMLHDKTHCSLFTNESIHRFVRDHGFEVERVTYPFPERYMTANTMRRWCSNSMVSPPWPGNWMTLYCKVRQWR